MDANLKCQMNCHACTLQEGMSAKVACATLLMPAMFSQMLNEIQELKDLLNKEESLEVAEVELPQKTKKQKIKEND